MYLKLTEHVPGKREPSLFVTVKDIDARLARLAPILAGAIAKLLALPSELIMG